MHCMHAPPLEAKHLLIRLELDTAGDVVSSLGTSLIAVPSISCSVSVVGNGRGISAGGTITVSVSLIIRGRLDGKFATNDLFVCRGLCSIRATSRTSASILASIIGSQQGLEVLGLCIHVSVSAGLLRGLSCRERQRAS